MINSFINIYAVPFGYTSDVDSEMNRNGDDLRSVFMTADMDCHTSRSPNGLPSLPDLIMSHTPPPSPLRRAYSYHFFPEKGEGTQGPLSLTALQRSLSAVQTPPPTPNIPEEKEREDPILVDGDGSPFTHCGCEGNCCSSLREDDPEVEVVRTGLQHIHEVRRRLGDPPAYFQPHQSLPELTWEVPAIRLSRRTVPSHAPTEGDERTLREEGNTQEWNDNRGGEERGGKDGVSGDSGVEDQQQRLRQIGNDLRTIADQFPDEDSSVSLQEGDGPKMAWSVAAAFSRCLSVSFLFLVWWRVTNRKD